MITIQVLKSVVLLSILQAVFSKRCSHSLHQSYLSSRHCNSSSGGSGDDTSSSTTTACTPRDSPSLNSYYLRKKGLAFVHSKKVRTFKCFHTQQQQQQQHYQSKSNIPSQVTAWSNRVTDSNSKNSFDIHSSRRSLFSFNLNDVGSWNKNNNRNNGDNDPKEEEDGTTRTTLADVDSPPSLSTNGNDNHQSEKDDDNDSMPPKKNTRDFPLASLINVEALLMASGQLPSNAEVDPGTSILVDMMSEVSNAAAAAASANSNNDRDGPEKESGQGTTASSSSSKSSGAMTLNSVDPTWENFVQSVQQNVKDLVDSPSTLKEATQSLESFVNDAAASFSPERVLGLIRSVALEMAVDQNADLMKMTVDRLVASAEKIAREQGLDVSTAAAQARATTKYTTEFLQVANGVLLYGYVAGSSGGTKNDVVERQKRRDLAKEMSISLLSDEDEKSSVMMSSAKPLFHRFPSVKRIGLSDFHQVSRKGAEMAKISGAIYQDTLPILHALGHSMVANATTANVRWMVSDSVGYESDFQTTHDDDRGAPMLIRTITIRGFDASDEEVDRELLLNDICKADPVPLLNNEEGLEGLGVHRGLLGIAKEIYNDLIPYIDTVGPSHKIVLTGHSIGGALANLILFLLTVERGNVFVKEKVKRVFTFGSPPIAIVDKNMDEMSDANIDPDDKNKNIEPSYDCSILDTLGLPNDMVFGYAQPLDPIVRFFSRIDALYPLIGDLGSDGVTMYASGPPRTLRPITRTILESWSNWPAFRDNYRGVLNQNYSSTGIQHLLMPDTGRYLADRLVNVNINAYDVDEVLRVSSDELYDALTEAFPLDIFQVSLVPTAIRSFIHHFFPAYSEGFEGYVSMVGRDRSDEIGGDDGDDNKASSSSTGMDIIDKEIETVKKLKLKSPTDQFGLWVLGGNEV